LPALHSSPLGSAPHCPGKSASSEPPERTNHRNNNIFCSVIMHGKKRNDTSAVKLQKMFLVHACLGRLHLDNLQDA
jgi:hypothetical protein